MGSVRIKDLSPEDQEIERAKRRVYMARYREKNPKEPVREGAREELGLHCKCNVDDIVEELAECSTVRERFLLMLDRACRRCFMSMIRELLKPWLIDMETKGNA